MLVPDELKLNKFREVNIPQNRDYFRSFGLVASSGTYSGDEHIDIHLSIQEQMQRASEMNAAALNHSE